MASLLKALGVRTRCRVAELREKPEHLKILEDWMKSYRPEELFDRDGKFKPELAALAPKGARRMGMNPHANGGLLLEPLRLPQFRSYAVEVKRLAHPDTEATRILGGYLRDVMKLNLEKRNFRVFGPDETASNRLEAHNGGHRQNVGGGHIARR